VTLLARSLGCVTTAEGVESGGALAWVSSLGCTQAQGYLFARPMPARDIPAYLARERITPPGVAAIEQVGLPLPL
jgi:EAL domain-containing protein (putative c-di-GMP-specific phosphodiesterase class I)